MQERRRPTLIQLIKDVLLLIMALVVAPLMAWLLLAAVQTQKDVLLIRVDLAAHIAARQKDMAENSTLHHTRRITPCVGCHEK